MALAFALALGFLAPARVTVTADSVYLRNAIVATVLFLMALPLLIDAVWRVVRRPGAACLSSFLNMPLIAWGLSNLLTGDLSVGLVLAAVVPSTMASASVWTRRAGGNDAVALVVTVVTVVTNGICFVVTPCWLLVILLHGLGLLTGLAHARAVGIGSSDRIAVAIAGSQKTLMVGLYVAIHYFGGLVLIPLVIDHVVQLLMDTVVADLWRRRTEMP